MRIALVDDDTIYHLLLQQAIKAENMDVEVDVFDDAEDFGNANISHYDAILVDQVLPTINGRDLIHSIHDKTDAYLALISAYYTSFEKNDIDRDYINGLLDKANMDQVLSWIRYADAKRSIRSHMDKEKESVDDLIKLTNGYTTDIRDGVAVIGVYRPLSNQSKANILDIVKHHGFCVVIYFTEKVGVVTSTHLSVLTSLWRLIIGSGGTMVFWLGDRGEEVMRLFQVCKLNNLMPVFPDLDLAIKHLNQGKKQCLMQKVR